MILFVFFVAYVLGAIPFGLLLARAAGLGDIRKTGSGNIGATNVARSGHRWLALCTLLLDAAKGSAAVIFAGLFFDRELAALAGMAAIFGHVFPLWLGFKGGKGVATTLGVLLTVNPVLGAAVCALWLGVFWLTGYSSLAALIGIGWSSAIAYVIDNIFIALLCLCIAALITYTHHANITRLLLGRELAFGKRP